ncbi:MAG: DsbA family oxidoreductase [Ginsengibacter sp.]
MEVKIWSDVRCPFCYIGKRKFEMALDKFSHKDKVKVTWHSFELDPSLETNPGINSIEHISRVKGISKQEGLEMHKHVISVAEEVGLNFDFEKSVVANSFNAHRLIQFAKSQEKGNEVEEELFKAHFTDGKNIDDKETLAQIGITIGLDEKSVKEVLDSNAFADEVKNDEQQAQLLGVRGVPFFVLNNKYGISGAQSSDTFLDALEQTWEEIKKEKQPLIITEGESCFADGNCN